MAHKQRSAIGGVMGLLLVPATLACGAAGPSPELVDARRAYDQANRSSAAELAPHEVLDARQALERAEAAHADDPGSEEERHLAYIAHREALEAVAEGEIADALRTIDRADKRYARLQEIARKKARSDLERAERELSQTTQELSSVRSELQASGEALGERNQTLREQERLLEERKAQLEARTKALEAEREARQKAEAAAAAAIASLEQIGRVNEEQRGTVITLSGSVLFATNQSTLLPIARQNLVSVANALKMTPEDRNIVVEGHTDSRGTDEHNMRLSHERASAVREFLVSQGVEPTRIQAVGRGESVPIADNSSPEGRANNRRVEIVIQPPAAQP